MFFFFKQKTAYEMLRSLVGSEMCIRDRLYSLGYRFGILPGTFISEPFNQVWQPRRLEMYTQDNAEEVFGRIFTYFLLFISFAALGVAVLTRDILVIIADREFWSAYKIVPVIALANVIFTFHYHFNLSLIHI